MCDNKCGNRKTTFIGEMRNSVLQWSDGPDLLVSRRGHRSIVVQNSVLHIGGMSNRFLTRNYDFL